MQKVKKSDVKAEINRDAKRITKELKKLANKTK